MYLNSKEGANGLGRAPASQAKESSRALSRDRFSGVRQNGLAGLATHAATAGSQGQLSEHGTVGVPVDNDEDR